ncbi:MAG TPA: hypothetical protein ENK29_03510, partial [Chromatiales bacterium]|nr:hypothetical protein [Chromatiales bacterium]
MRDQGAAHGEWRTLAKGHSAAPAFYQFENGVVTDLTFAVMRITTKKTAKRNPARIGYIYFLKYIMSNRFLDINSDTACSSNLPIDIVIPVAEKDAMVLPLVVQSIKAFARHPINKFYVISPLVEEVKPYLESHQIE